MIGGITTLGFLLQRPDCIGYIQGSKENLQKQSSKYSNVRISLYSQDYKIQGSRQGAIEANH